MAPKWHYFSVFIQNPVLMMVRELLVLPKKVNSSFLRATQRNTFNKWVFYHHVRQTKSMLPRRKTNSALVIGLGILVTGAFSGQPPVQGYVRTPPKVSIHNFSPKPQTPARVGKNLIIPIMHKIELSKFSLVGVTWQGNLPHGTDFQVKLHDDSGWTTWQQLSYSPEHGPDTATSEAKDYLRGTDPLLTARSDGIQVRAISRVAKLPKNLNVSLIDSAVTDADKSTFRSARNSVGTQANLTSVTTKSGAVVNRPNIVTRAQWGADESWRQRSPRVSSKIIAGFIHHTATTNSYNPEDGPAQMRTLYAYFTKSLKYADMGYNFLVDKYGVVYEGRAGCTPSAGSRCDGPAKAVIGAHTAGMNEDTFAISAIGNFQTGTIDDDTAKSLTNAIAGLMAWKIAPYNLDPSAMATIPSTDTSGLSKYRKGTVATVPVISGHRDVGRTVCPGKYLYPLLPEIRNQIAGLLIGRIQNLAVSPIEQLASHPKPISLTAKLPSSGSWNVTVVSAQSGEVVFAQSGTQQGKPEFSFEWDHMDQNQNLLAAGSYAISLSATIAAKQLPTETTMVTLASKPARMSGLKISRISASTALVTWPAQVDSVPLVDSISYRTSATKGRTWNKWRKLPETALEQLISSKLARQKILIEFKQENAVGESVPVQISFVTESR